MPLLRFSRAGMLCLPLLPIRMMVALRSLALVASVVLVLVQILVSEAEGLALDLVCSRSLVSGHQALDLSVSDRLVLVHIPDLKDPLASARKDLKVWWLDLLA